MEAEQSLLFIAYHGLIEYPFKIKAAAKILVNDHNDEPETQKLKYYLYHLLHASFFLPFIHSIIYMWVISRIADNLPIILSTDTVFVCSGCRHHRE